MAPTPDPFDARSILSFLRQGRSEAERLRVPEARLQDFREAAAVVSAFSDLSTLRLLDGEALPVSADVVLHDDLIAAPGAKLKGSVMLAPEIRRMAIRRLYASGRLEQALAANPQERTSLLDRRFEQCLRGNVPPLEGQSLEELTATQQVLTWLEDSVPNLPSLAEVESRIGLLRLLAPFEAIAGDAVFRGRRSELDRLRSYVGVLPPESILLRLRDAAFRWVEPERKPALSLHGPGGVGKSALVARFMLEHLRVTEGGRVPFAYLDFDRPGLDVGDPVGLCVEMVRQLDIQFPGHERFGPLRSFAESAEVRRAGREDPDRRIHSARSLLADLLGIVRSQLGPRPYVVVLDTFEEVQYRGESRAYPLWQLLDDLQKGAPFLRVIVSGRAPVESLRLADAVPQQIALEDLDTEGAVSFLAAQGVSDTELARQLVRAFGALPLSLKLIAALVTKHGESWEELNSVARRGSWFVRASTSLQAQLYERLLGHIHDERVRRLAHPGLVLRRITPEIIRHVLDGPCELRIESDEDAARLFESLRKETALVSSDDDDGSLVHRTDLRRIMLKLLVETEPARVEQIQRAAVEWYARQGEQLGRRARAEELYHRLKLGERVPAARLRDSEVRGSVQASIVEFDPPIQRHLATLGFQVPKGALEQASREERHAALAAQVEDLLPYGERSLEHARSVLAAAPDSEAETGPLHRARARVEAQLGNPVLALQWIERGLECSAGAGSTRHTLELLKEKAWLERETSPGVLRNTLERLDQFAQRHKDPDGQLQHKLQTLDRGSRTLRRDLAGIEDRLRRMGPGDLWSLAPAVGTALRLAFDARHADTLIPLLREHVHHPEGQFRYASFPFRQASAELAQLLSADTAGEFAAAYLNLCAVWPYRVLYVRAPFGRSGESVSASAS